MSLKTCDNCGKYNDCRNSNANWLCHNASAWEPIEPDASTMPRRRDK